MLEKIYIHVSFFCLILCFEGTFIEPVTGVVRVKVTNAETAQLYNYSGFRYFSRHLEMLNYPLITKYETYKLPSGLNKEIKKWIDGDIYNTVNHVSHSKNDNQGECYLVLGRLQQHVS